MNRVSLEVQFTGPIFVCFSDCGVNFGILGFLVDISCENAPNNFQS